MSFEDHNNSVYDPWLDLRGGTEADVAAKPALQIETIENVAPLDAQFGTLGKKTVPDKLYDVILGQPDLTEAEITAAGGHTIAVPLMQSYAILDAAKVVNLPMLLDSSGLEHRCLFKGAAYDDLKNVAPWIVRLEDGNRFTRSLFTGPKGCNGLWETEPGIFIRSRSGLDDLWRHFRKFTRVQGIGNKTYFFRYWSHHVFLAWMMESRRDSTFPFSFFEDGSKINLRTILAYDALGGTAWKITQGHNIPLDRSRKAFKLSKNEENIFRRTIVRPFVVEMIPYLRKEHANLCSEHSLIDLHDTVETSLMRLHKYGFLRQDILFELVVQDLYLGRPFEDEDKTGKMREICRLELTQEDKYQQLCSMIDRTASFEQVDRGI